MRSPEGLEQERVIQWARWMSGKYPELEYLYHIPNGGKRSKTEAARFRAEGVKAGVSDLHLPIPMHGFHGLWIEMKVKPNKPTEAQTDWLDAMARAGHATAVCYSADEAIRVLEAYHNGTIDKADCYRRRDETLMTESTK